MIDAAAFRLLLLTAIGWLDRREREALAYLIEENRVLRRQLGGRRLRLTDDDRGSASSRSNTPRAASRRCAATVSAVTAISGVSSFTARVRCAAIIANVRTAWDAG